MGYAPPRCLVLALIVLLGVPSSVWAQSAPPGSSVLSDRPASSRTLNDMDRPSSDSSLLLDDRSTANLETILRDRTVKVEKPIFPRSPIENIAGRTYGLVTAEHLHAGEMVQSQVVRLFGPNSAAVNDDLLVNQSNQTIYGLTDDIELTLDLQGANGSVPGLQEPYVVQRRVGTNNANLFQDFTFQGKIRLGSLLSGQSSLVVGITTSRPQFTFSPLNANSGLTTVERRQEGTTLVPSLELPITYRAYDDRYAFTISPKIAFFANDNAIYTPVNPGASGSFGFTFAVGLGGAFKISPRFQIRGDVSPVLVGNNTVSRTSGSPATVLPFNVGLRYLVNPRLGIDLFATNTFGNTGAPGLVAFTDSTGFGIALTTTPERFLSFFDISANRRFAETFELDVPKEIRRIYLPGGFDLLDGSTIPGGTTRVQLQATTGTIGTALRLGALDDFETGFFADFAPGGVDESDAGASTKVRLLHQPSGDPFTLSALVTIGRTSSRACNFINGTRDGLERVLTGRPNNCPGVPGVTPAGDRGPIPANLFGLNTENVGELIIASFSAPFQYSVLGGPGFWVNPKLVYIQRGGDRSPLIGISLGASVPVLGSLNLIAQISPVLRGDNAFIGETLANVLPWQAGVRYGLGQNGPTFDLYATNALGFSPYQSLRVRADNQVSVGLGLQVPF